MNSGKNAYRQNGDPQKPIADFSCKMVSLSSLWWKFGNERLFLQLEEKRKTSLEERKTTNHSKTEKYILKYLFHSQTIRKHSSKQLYGEQAHMKIVYEYFSLSYSKSL